MSSNKPKPPIDGFRDKKMAQGGGAHTCIFGTSHGPQTGRKDGIRTQFFSGPPVDPSNRQKRWHSKAVHI